jgi:hypothetical protein
MMKVRFIASLVMALCFAVSANASSIGVFSDPAGASCNFNVQPFTPFSIYIIATLAGDAAAAGITGAELRLTNVDPAWFNTVTPGPGSNLSLGSPIDAVGGNIAWPACQTTGTVLLYSISSLALSLPSGRILGVVARNPPSNINFNCPLISQCDAAFTLFCVRHGEAFLNLAGVPPCNVGVAQKSWSGVKQLFQN